MGKTRCLRKYRRKSKQVKTRNKCSSKKSRKRAISKDKKNKRTVKKGRKAGNYFFKTHDIRNESPRKLKDDFNPEKKGFLFKQPVRQLMRLPMSVVSRPWRPRHIVLYSNRTGQGKITWSPCNGCIENGSLQLGPSATVTIENKNWTVLDPEEYRYIKVIGSDNQILMLKGDDIDAWRNKIDAVIDMSRYGANSGIELLDLQAQAPPAESLSSPPPSALTPDPNQFMTQPVKAPQTAAPTVTSLDMLKMLPMSIQKMAQPTAPPDNKIVQAYMAPLSLAEKAEKELEEDTKPLVDISTLKSAHGEKVAELVREAWEKKQWRSGD